MRVILCITNDIVTDQRIRRIADSLTKIYSGVVIAGTGFKKSMPFKSDNYKIHRIRMVFNRGPVFYIEYNLRLFLYLIFHRADVLVANDLDTLPAVFLASLLKSSKLIYDSHEYFTELPELIHRNFTRKIWESIEKILLPSVKYSYTVSDSIARAYHEKYGINMGVVRNLPLRMKNPGVTKRLVKEKIIIYQGALNIGRGLENAIRAMHYLNNACLIIAGSGYYAKQLEDLADSLKLNDKIRFTGRLNPEDLKTLTCQADIGISLEEKTGLNYLYALPNKLFDYIQARVPVLVTNLPEMAAIVNQYDIGYVADIASPQQLASVMEEMLENNGLREKWKINLETAAEALNWEKEESKLIDIHLSARS